MHPAQTPLHLIPGTTHRSTLRIMQPTWVYKPVTLDDELREQIKSASPHVWLINERVRDKIAEAYPLHEEIKLLRTAPSAEFEAYNAHAEACREWGRAQKALLGL